LTRLSVTRIITAVVIQITDAIVVKRLRPLFLTKEQLDAALDYEDKIAEESRRQLSDRTKNEAVTPVPVVLQTTDHVLRNQAVRYLSDVACVAVTYPLDVVKTRLVAQVNKANYDGIRDCASQIYNHNKFDFYKGVQYLLISNGVYFSIMTASGLAIDKVVPRDEQKLSRKIIRGVLTLSTVILANVAAYPFTIVQHRMQVGDTSYDGLGVIGALQKIVQEEGTESLWKGFFYA
jgi:hypothetical protein